MRLLRHLPDRLLHAFRRRRAKRQVSALRGSRVVFLCHGNINRSAYAEAAFRELVPAGKRNDVVVRSAGFIGPDRPASELAHATALQRGIDLSGHTSRSIDPAELKEADLVVVMTPKQYRDVCRIAGMQPVRVVILGDLDPHPIDTRNIRDPYGHGQEVFDPVFDRIDRCLQELATSLWPI